MDGRGKCARYEDLVARFLHAELLLQEKEDLERHLAECSACATLYGEIADVDRLLREAPEKQVDPPPYLRARILAHLPEREAAEGPGLRWGRWAAAAAGVAACAMIAFALFRESVLSERYARTASPPPAGITGPRDAPQPESPPPGTVAPRADETVGVAASSGSAVATEGTVRIVREVRIYFYHPGARKVAVTGDFNGWDADGVPLGAGGKPGLWETKLRLPPGAYSYNFIVDGNVLVPDPNAPNQMPDGYGGTNSIMLVREGDSA